MLWKEFRKPDNIEDIIKNINELRIKPIRIMEICGTHTMSIAKAGIKSILPKSVKLISGPGCPVCVTPVEHIENILKLSESKDVIIATYGDMLKVPGVKYGDSLEKRKALGANVEMVYSAVDAVEIAKNNPQKEVVFLGIGFETTTPATAIAIEVAHEQQVNNFYVLSMHKTVEPILRTLIKMDDFDIDGLLCPGHVAVILGEDGFRFLPDEYKLPAVISGFEAGDILTAIYKLMLQIKDGRSELENEYTRAVSKKGNTLALEKTYKYFEACDDFWRGIGLVPDSGLKLKKEYEKYDAVKRYDLRLNEVQYSTNCKCGEIIKGKVEPYNCPLFGKACNPANPVGPCMVSSEGACAAYYKYQR